MSPSSTTATGAHAAHRRKRVGQRDPRPASEGAEHEHAGARAGQRAAAPDEKEGARSRRARRGRARPACRRRGPARRRARTRAPSGRSGALTVTRVGDRGRRIAGGPRLRRWRARRGGRALVKRRSGARTLERVARRDDPGREPPADAGHPAPAPPASRDSDRAAAQSLFASPS